VWWVIRPQKDCEIKYEPWDNNGNCKMGIKDGKGCWGELGDVEAGVVVKMKKEGRKVKG
jgi:hypothetical protein